MRNPIAWSHRLEDHTKVEVKVHFSGGKLKWQFKRSDREKWDYDSVPTLEDWNALLHHAEARYRRNRVPYDHVELIKKFMPKQN